MAWGDRRPPSLIDLFRRSSRALLQARHRRVKTEADAGEPIAATSEESAPADSAAYAQPPTDSLEAQDSATGVERRRSEVRQLAAQASKKNARPDRNSIESLKRRRARMASLRRRLRTVSATVADPLGVWQRSLPLLARRHARRSPSPVAVDDDGVVQDPDAVYRRSMAWQAQAELRRACIGVDLALNAMVTRGFLARAARTLSFADWKAHTEYRYRSLFYDAIEAEIGAFWMALP